jgi:hypothetical protein
MPSPSTYLALFVAGLTLFGCTSSRATPPAATAAAPPSAPIPSSAPSRRAGQVYRLDFVLSSKDSSGGVVDTTFTLNLEETHAGEVLVGKNVALAAAPGPSSSPRQDVGLKVKARFEPAGDDLLLDVATELSTFEPPSVIRKVVAEGNALAAPGKSTLVVSLDSDERHYELSVTPTKLR